MTRAIMQLRQVLAYGRIERGTPNSQVKLTFIRGGQPREPRVSKLAATRTRSDHPTTPTTPTTGAAA